MLAVNRLGLARAAQVEVGTLIALVANSKYTVIAGIAYDAVVLNVSRQDATSAAGCCLTLFAHS